MACPSNSISSIPRKRRKRTNDLVGTPTYRFFQSWRDEYKWLTYDDDEDLIFCNICKQFTKSPNPASPYVAGTKATRSNSLAKHHLSSSHLKAEADLRAVENPHKTPLALTLRKMKSETLERMRCLFNTAYFVAKEQLAFAKFENLCFLQSLNGLAIGHMYTNDKRAREFVGFIAEAMRQKQTEQLGYIKYISVMSDSSTDRSFNEKEIIYIRYLDQNCIPQTLYAGLGALEKANAKGIFETIDRVFLKRGWTDWKEKTVGFGADGASVMMGRKGGVAALLKADIPHLIEIHCVAHRLQLSVLDAIHDHPYIVEFEGGLKKLFSFYNKSPKRLRELGEMADVLEETVKRFGSIHEVRWMASRKNALTVTIDNWRVVVSHLENAPDRVVRDEPAKAKSLLKVIISYKWVSYLHFLADFMGELTKFSLQLQSEDLTGTKLLIALDATEMGLHNLCRRHGRYLSGFLENCVGGTWLGIELRDADSTHDKELCSILESTILYIGERFQRNDVTCAFTVFNPGNWPREILQLASFGEREVNLLVNHFKSVMPLECSVIKVLEEWTELKAAVCHHQKNWSTVDPSSIYERLVLNQIKFQNIAALMEISLVMPWNTAACERGFSYMNLIKTSHRSCLQHDTVDDLLQVSVNGPTLKNFSPDQALELWWVAARKQRHVYGHRSQKIMDTNIGTEVNNYAEIEEIDTDICQSTSGSEIQLVT